MADIDGRRRHHDPPASDLAARRTIVGMIGTAAVVVVGLGSLAIAGSDGSDAQASRLPATFEPWVAGAPGTAPDEPTGSTPGGTLPPNGWHGVVGDAGEVVGYLRPEDERAALDGGEPPLQLGASPVAFRGLTVVDAAGDPVGWFLSGDLGFVSAEEVADPDQLAAIEATWLAEHPELGP